MAYLVRNQRYTLLKLKKSFTTLDDVSQRILNRKHLEPLTVKNMPTDAPEEEITFKSEWHNSSEQQEVSFENTDQTFNYLKVTAYCEFSTRRLLDPTTGELLPKSDRLNTALVEVLFVEIESEVYAVVFSSDFYDLRRVKKLIDETFIDPLTSVHNIHSELFHWLFFKYIKEDHSLDEKINIDNINGFTGTVLNEEHMFEGRSAQTAELIITKAFITNGYPITSIQTDLQISDASISFYLNEVLDGKELKILVAKNSSINNILNSEEIEYIVPLYIFFYLIPRIVSLYKNGEKEFLSNTKTDFSKEIGVEVIKTIMAKNNISVDEVS